MSDRVLPPVMILGCGRSGTSIFGELFDHIPSYTYRSEPPFADVMTADYSVPQAFKVPRECSAFAPDPGLSFPLTELASCAPAMKFFWIVRHPLDAICSLRVGIAQDWRHHPRPPDWQDWLNRPLIDRCAHHWTFLNSVGWARVAEIATIVRFEDMISDPEGFAFDVCKRIGLETRVHAAEIGAWARRVQDTDNAEFIEAETSRAYSRSDHSVRVGRWRENLSAQEIASVVPIVSETARSVGYSIA